MKALNKKLETLNARISAMSLRERAFVFAAAVMLVFAVVQLVYIDGGHLRKQAAGARVEAATAALEQIEAQRLALGGDNGHDPDQAARVMLATQQARLVKLNQDLELRERALIPPSRMQQVLKDVMQRQPGIQIVGFRTLRPQPVVLPDAGEEVRPGFYRHGFEVAVSGHYSELVAYLARLEALPWRLNWSEAALDASGRPLLTLTLTVHTLSLEEAWLRV